MTLHVWNEKSGSIWKVVGDLEIEVSNVGDKIGGGVCLAIPVDILAIDQARGRFDCFEFGILIDE